LLRKRIKVRVREVTSQLASERSICWKPAERYSAKKSQMCKQREERGESDIKNQR